LFLLLYRDCNFYTDRKALRKIVLLPLQLAKEEGGGTIFHIDHTVDKLKAIEKVELYKFLYHLYDSSPSLLEPLGGESRDVNNRRRKHLRGFYGMDSSNLSKFSG
jgi:hypothetical protein